MQNGQVNLSSADLVDGLIELSWSDGFNSHYHPLWLRDNCRCADCGDPATGYRKLRTSAIDPECKPQSLEADAAGLSLIWPDGHRSDFGSDWLRKHAYDDSARRARAFQPVPWDDAFRHNPPHFEYADIADIADIADSDAELLRLLQQLRDFGICFIRNAPAISGILEAFATRFGHPQESNFGRVQDLKYDPEQQSIAFDVKALKAHTDEPYRASPPGILIFHCIANDQSGAGGSIFIDGFEIAQNLRAADTESFDALCRFAQPFRRHFAGDVDLIAEFPILSVDEFGKLCGIRLNDRVAAPLALPPEQLVLYYRGLQYLLAQSERDDLALQITLQPGDIAIFDNHRVLHGRTDLTIHGQRWLQWVQIERGDFHSSLRIIADRLGMARDDRPLLRGAYGSVRNGRKA